MTVLHLHNTGIIGRSDIEIHPQITLICGNNMVGKSTTFRAIRSLLLDTGACVTGVLKDDGPLMVGPRAKKAFAGFSDGGAKHNIQWPTCKPVKGEGKRADLPSASEWAAGGRVNRDGPLLSLFEVNPTERLKVFSEMFASDPSLADLQKALAEAGVGDVGPEKEGDPWKPYQDVWDQVQGDGRTWDEAESHYKGVARDAKARWCEVTGRRAYSPDDAPDWQAEVEHAPDAEPFDFDAAEAVLLAAKEEEARISEEYAAIPPHNVAAHSPTCPRCKMVRSFFAEMKEAPEHIVARVNEITGTCQLQLVQGELHAYEAKPAEKVKEEGMDRNSLAAQLSNSQTVVAEFERKIAYEKGKADFDADGAKKRAEEATARALELHEEIEQNLLIAGVVSPTGLRKVKLEKTIVEVAAGLNEVAEQMGLGTIGLDNDLNVTLSTRPYAHLSVSERWLVHAALQLEIARYDESSLVLLDGFDVLRAHYRQKMIETLLWANIPAVLFMSANGPADVPDLNEKGAIGLTYWISDGEIKPIAEAIAAVKVAA